MQSSEIKHNFLLPKQYRRRVLILHDLDGEPFLGAQMANIGTALNEFGHVTKTATPGRVFPKSIFNKLGWLLFVIRSFLLTFWILARNIFCPTNMIITSLHYSVLPFLRLFTNAKIVYVETEVLLQRFSDSTHVPSILEVFNLLWAHEVLVANRLSGYLYSKANNLLTITPKVQFPFIRVPSVHNADEKILAEIPDFPINTRIFLSIVVMEPNSKILVGIQAFKLLIDRLKKFKQPTPVFCILITKYDTNSDECNAYYKQLINFITASSLTEHVFMHRSSNEGLYCALIARAYCLTVTASDEIFNPNLINALQLATPIISINDGFGNEILEHGYNGLLVNLDSASIGKAMLYLYRNRKITKCMAYLAAAEFDLRYCYERYTQNLNRFLLTRTLAVKLEFSSDRTAIAILRGSSRYIKQRLHYMHLGIKSDIDRPLTRSLYHYDLQRMRTNINCDNAEYVLTWDRIQVRRTNRVCIINRDNCVIDHFLDNVQTLSYRKSKASISETTKNKVIMDKLGYAAVEMTENEYNELPEDRYIYKDEYDRETLISNTSVVR